MTDASALTLPLPVAAGRLFDLSGGYAGAVAIATAGNVLGFAIAAGLARRPAGPARPGAPSA